MCDRSAANCNEVLARRAVVTAARAMLSGTQSFFEGAAEVHRLRKAVGGIGERDPDFDAFLAIESETDHLPLPAQRPLWNPVALTALSPEFERTEVWAKSFAPDACRNLIKRFSAN